jgi:HlyD family secretion protein
MSAFGKRLTFWGTLLAVLAVALWLLLRPQPIDVDVVRTERGPMRVVVAEDGVTRVRDLFVLSAPIRGRALRIDIEEGDDVIANKTVVAEIEPVDPEFLDIRSQAEAKAAVDMAEAALQHARARLTQARAELDFATAERDRMRELRASNTVAARSLEDAERVYLSRLAAVDTEKAAIRMRAAELEAARIRLLRPTETAGLATCPCIPIRAPVDGKVLRVLHESEGVVNPGQPLVEIGNPGDLEIVVDFPSGQAVRIAPGQRAIIDGWGGGAPLEAEVRVVEPYGFTKVSALGIEEQRVNVVLDITDPPDRWSRLGHGFEVEVRVVLWEGAKVLQVPLTALFRDGENWAVFVVQDDRAMLRRVETGHRTDLMVEIVGGLVPDEQVIRYPNRGIEAGALVTRQ